MSLCISFDTDPRQRCNTESVSSLRFCTNHNVLASKAYSRYKINMNM